MFVSCKISLLSIQNGLLTAFFPVTKRSSSPLSLPLVQSPIAQFYSYNNNVIQSDAGFDVEKINVKRNASVAQLYEDAVMYENAVISASGALINFSGKKTGRSPKDKRIVYEDSSKDDVWVSILYTFLPVRL